MYQFGVGGLFGVPTGGNLATPSFPQKFGVIQDVNVDIDQKLVELRGQNKFPDDIAPSDMNIKGKASFANIEIQTYNSLFFGDTISTGMKIMVDSEAGTIPATPFAITVTGSATWSK